MATFTENSVRTTGARCHNGLTPVKVVWTYTDEKYSTLAANDFVNLFQFPDEAEIVIPDAFTVTADGDWDTNGTETWQFDLQVADDEDGTGNVQTLIANCTVGQADADTDALDTTPLAIEYNDVGGQWLAAKVDALPATAGEGAKIVFRFFYINSANESQA